jgi:hypothetical protein
MHGYAIDGIQPSVRQTLARLCVHAFILIMLRVCCAFTGEGTMEAPSR